MTEKDKQSDAPRAGVWARARAYVLADGSPSQAILCGLLLGGLGVVVTAEEQRGAGVLDPVLAAEAQALERERAELELEVALVERAGVTEGRRREALTLWLEENLHRFDSFGEREAAWLRRVRAAEAARERAMGVASLAEPAATGDPVADAYSFVEHERRKQFFGLEPGEEWDRASQSFYRWIESPEVAALLRQVAEEEERRQVAEWLEVVEPPAELAEGAPAAQQAAAISHAIRYRRHVAAADAARRGGGIAEIREAIAEETEFFEAAAGALDSLAPELAAERIDAEIERLAMKLGRSLE